MTLNHFRGHTNKHEVERWKKVLVIHRTPPCVMQTTRWSYKTDHQWWFDDHAFSVMKICGHDPVVMGAAIVKIYGSTTSVLYCAINNETTIYNLQSTFTSSFKRSYEVTYKIVLVETWVLHLYLTSVTRWHTRDVIYKLNPSQNSDKWTSTLALSLSEWGNITKYSSKTTTIKTTFTSTAPRLPQELFGKFPGFARLSFW